MQLNDAEFELMMREFVACVWMQKQLVLKRPAHGEYEDDQPVDGGPGAFQPRTDQSCSAACS